MTYRELAILILDMDKEQQSSDVTIHAKESDEFIAVGELRFAWGCDVLDSNHPFLEIDL